jgi:flagellar biosynthetic protein FlhB
VSVEDRERRTLKPTPKRVQDFRKRGEIAISRDLTGALVVGCGLTVGFLFAHTSFQATTELLRRTFTGLSTIDTDHLGPIIEKAASAFGVASLPIVAGAFLGLLVAAIVQLGFPPAFAPLRFDIMRPFSMAGLLPLFSPKAAVGRLLRSFAKVALVLAAAAHALHAEYQRFLVQPALTSGALVERILDALSSLSLHAGGALVLLGVVEYALQKRDLDAKMRMTPEEMKREMKEQDGDPAIRRKRKQRMRELAKHRLSQAVKGADVVVVNPTEYAVAIRYRATEGGAPRVVAKGRKHVAEKIREIARQHQIPILPEPPLARLLYKVVPEGREIPANLYQAVAEVLAYVYRLKRRSR